MGSNADRTGRMLLILGTGLVNLARTHDIDRARQVGRAAAQRLVAGS